MSSVALYQALKAAGVDDSLAAKAAADIHPAPDSLVTQADLKATVAELRAEMAQQTNRIVIQLGLWIGVVGALVKYLP